MRHLSFVGLIGFGLLALVGCSDDGGTTDSTGGAGAGGAAGGSAGTATGGSGTGGSTAGSSTGGSTAGSSMGGATGGGGSGGDAAGGDSAGAGGDGGSGGAMASAECMSYCGDLFDTCGDNAMVTGKYATEDDCLTACAAESGDTWDFGCRQTHLTNAQNMDPGTHCPHAVGIDLCTDN